MRIAAAPPAYAIARHAGRTAFSNARTCTAKGASERIAPTVIVVAIPATTWTASSTMNTRTSQPAPAYRSRDSASTVPQRADDGLRPERAAAVALDAVEQLVDDGRRRERHAEPRRGGERETKILLLETHHEARREV